MDLKRMSHYSSMTSYDPLMTRAWLQMRWKNFAQNMPWMSGVDGYETYADKFHGEPTLIDDRWCSRNGTGTIGGETPEVQRFESSEES